MEHPISCIYKIICKDGRYYIGSTVNFSKRKNRHLRELKKGNHHNHHLQNIYTKYGSDFIHIEIYEKIDKNMLFNRETEIIQQHFNDRCCINVLATSTFGDTLSKHPNKKEIIIKRTKSFRSVMDSLSPDERKEMNGRYGSNNGSYGRKRTMKEIESCKNFGKISGDIIKKRTSGKKCEEIYGKEKATEMKAKLSKSMKQLLSVPENNPFYGKEHSEESKMKQSIDKKGTFNKYHSKPINIDETTYLSINQASGILGISTATIIFRLKSKSDKFKNYNYIDDNKTREILDNYKKYDITNIYK
jgi:group I intron endonuclease